IDSIPSGQGRNRRGRWRTHRMNDGFVPDEAEIFSWVETVFERGVRRPGYPADRWVESWIADRFGEIGLDAVRAEPVELRLWEPRAASPLVTAGDGTTLEPPCFALPHSVPVADIEADLVAFDADAPDGVRGAISLYDVPLLRIPHTALAGLATWSLD